MKSAAGRLLPSFALGSSIILAACATPQYNYRADMVEISEPPLGTTNIKSVGETLLRQGRYTETDALLLHKTTTVGLVGTYTFNPGYYTKVGEDDKSSFYEPEIGPEGGGIVKGVFADPYKSMRAFKDGSKLCGISVLNGQICNDDTSFEFVRRVSLTANSFQRSLLYNGGHGSKINIGYREFSNNTARPAFNNDVEYDLADSKIIAYKGAQLEIIEATNQHLKYRLIKNFNDADR